MRYVIDGFLQTKIIEFKLSERERKLLEFINFVNAGGQTIRQVFNNENYIWLNYSKFIYEYPYLEIPNTKQVGVHIKALENKGFIKLYVDVTPNGTFTYISLANLYFSLWSSNPENYNHFIQKSHSDFNSKGVRFESQGGTIGIVGLADEIAGVEGQNRTHNNQPTINHNKKSIKKENEELNKEVNLIIDYYDLKAKTKTNKNTGIFKAVSKNIKKLLNEYSVDQCKQVIDYIICDDWYIRNNLIRLSTIFRTSTFHEKLDKCENKTQVVANENNNHNSANLNFL